MEGKCTGQRHRPTRSALNALLGLALLLSAAAGAKTEWNVTAVTSPAATAAAGGDGTPDRLRVGGDADYPPYHFLDALGRADGFDVELVRAVAADLGMEAVFELGDWSTTLERLARGELDAVPMFWSEARGQRYLFTEPILLRHHALFGHYETPTVESLDGLANVRVAVQRSGLAWEALRELDRAGVTVVALDNEAATLDLVARGEADYALVPTGIGYYMLRHQRLSDVVALSPPLLERRYVFAVRPGQTALVARINRSLQRLRRDGVQNRLYEEWIGHPAPRRAPGFAGEAVRPSGAIALLAAAVAGVVLLTRRRGVADAIPASSSRLTTGAVRNAAAAAAEDTMLMVELRDAITRGELGYCLQPKIDLRSGRLLGAELLVRWEHPRFGPLGPDAFVPIAEQTDTIGEMTLYLARCGLEQCRRWAAADERLHVSVNVSANDLADPRLVDAIIEATGSHGHCLMLEITETAVMREPERVAVALPRLRAHGIRISVDDFGVGHSSLVNLRRLAPDELKIDRSFVAAVLDSASDRAIVRATIQLGHELGASVVAEGIEDEATRAWLAAAGCDSGQGFGIAKPMPAARFMELLG